VRNTCAWSTKDSAQNPLFEAEGTTDFASKLAPVKLVAADIGRVLLNPYANVFYTLHSRQQVGEASYQPVLRVHTLQRDGQVEIQIQDDELVMSEAIQGLPFSLPSPRQRHRLMLLAPLRHHLLRAWGHPVGKKVSKGTTCTISLSR
jgi:hypothetical protein